MYEVREEVRWDQIEGGQKGGIMECQFRRVCGRGGKRTKEEKKRQEGQKNGKEGRLHVRVGKENVAICSHA